MGLDTENDGCMICKAILETTDRYLLRFAPGVEWQLVSSPEKTDLLHRTAFVMDLEKVTTPPNAPRMLFTRCDPSCETCLNLATEKSIDSKENGLDETRSWKSFELPYMRMWIHPGRKDILCQCLHWDNVVSDMARIKGALNPVYSSIIEQDGFPVHGALVQYDGKGILLAGHGDVGKSTACARLPHPFEPLCDDETLIVYDNGAYYAHPMPTWSSYQNDAPLKSTSVRQKVPLAAIFFLKQSPKDYSIPMGKGESSVRLHQSSSETLATYAFFSLKTVTGDIRKKLYDNTSAVSKNIPSYTLHLSLTGDFWTDILAIQKKKGL
ncbi:MAG: SynChlorMet cassette protein ScmC [Proteobacteria bacterium]|nr:SynChlorMet cassette protein ScmC [Pseudomonadota bacterium]